jgi:hypothetical protein
MLAQRSEGLRRDHVSLHTLALLGLAVIGASPLRADVIPPGHKPVEHVVVISEALANGEVLAAAPTRGFHGIQTVVPGEPFSFSSKYGTRLYALPADQPVPGDVAAVRAAALASSDIPVSEVTSVPLADPLARVVTTLRITAPASNQLVVEVLSEERFDSFGARGNLRALLLTLCSVAAVGIGALVLVRRRLRGARNA